MGEAGAGRPLQDPSVASAWTALESKQRSQTHPHLRVQGQLDEGCLPVHSQVQVTLTSMGRPGGPVPWLRGVCRTRERRGPGPVSSCSNPSPHQGAEGLVHRHGSHTAHSSSSLKEYGGGGQLQYFHSTIYRALHWAVGGGWDGHAEECLPCHPMRSTSFIKPGTKGQAVSGHHPGPLL